jgi:hypothetical protein
MHLRHSVPVVAVVVALDLFFALGSSLVARLAKKAPAGVI